jgi:hypothetical protein
MRCVCVSRKKRLSLIFLIFSQAAVADQVDLLFRWGHDSRFWKNVDNLRSTSDLVDRLDDIFESNYRDPTEGSAHLSLGYMSAAPEAMAGTFERGQIRLNYDRIAGGEIFNRISPELRGYEVWATSFQAQLFSEPATDESGIEFSLGSDLGIGRQTLIEGPITDFLEEAPQNSSMLFYYGLNLSLGGKMMVSPNLRFRYGAQLNPTYFYSAFKDPSYEFRVESGKLYTRWRGESEFAALWQGWGHGEIGVHALTGQQPVPVTIIPRVWDAVHKIEVFPSLGSVVGAGTFFRIASPSKRYSFEAMGGFYGGYVGGALNLKLYYFELQLGSFGLEQTAGFQVRESRVQYIAGRLYYVW